MACSHTAACPLFPLLNSSLDGWRRCYCDSEDGWRQCARYQQSIRGQYVPLSLLPNGHDAHHLAGTGAGRATEADSAAGPPWSTGASGPTVVDLLFQQAPSPEATPPTGERQVRLIPAPRASSPRMLPPPARPLYGTGPRRPWWRRLAEWMRTPA